MKKVFCWFENRTFHVIYDETKEKALLNALWDALEQQGVQDITSLRDVSFKEVVVNFLGGFSEPIKILRQLKVK